jgi:DNA modification methylase
MQIQIPEISLENVSDIKTDGKNPNAMPQKKYEALKKNILRYGFLIPIITNNELIIADGEHRLKVAKEIGMEKVPCIKLDVSEVDRRILRQVMNKLKGEHNPELDQAEFKFLEENNSINEFAELMGEEDYNFLSQDIVEEDDFQEPEKAKYDIKVGEVWVLGNHRLMCGDCADYISIQKLFSDKTGNCLITDPPYGVSYNSKNEFLNKLDKGSRVQREILNDHNIENYRKWFGKWLANLKPYIDNTFHIFINGKEQSNLVLACGDVDIKYCQDLVWVKNNHVLGRLDYNSKHENILYGWFHTHKFYGGHQTSIIHFDKPLKSNLHPTMKPVGLIAELISHVTQKNGIVVDVFGGSGTTLIACEQTGRICYMMELDPYYCSVIIERWEQYTGKKAVREDSTTKTKELDADDFGTPA